MPSHPNDLAIDRASEKISLVYAYEKEYLKGIEDLLNWIGTKQRVGMVSYDELGPISQREYSELRFGDAELVRFTDGTLLWFHLEQGFSYSEHTEEPASVTWIGFTPQV